MVKVTKEDVEGYHLGETRPDSLMHDLRDRGRRLETVRKEIQIHNDKLM